MERLFFILTVFVGIGCSAQQHSVSTLDLNTLKPLIKKAGTTWGKAIKQKEISLLADLYDENAHYLPNDANALHGREAILEYWSTSLDFMSDLKLNMETLEGTKELLYETGNGLALILSENGQTIELPFKYVNVWKLQVDGSYRVVIDTFNNPSSN